MSFLPAPASNANSKNRRRKPRSNFGQKWRAESSSEDSDLALEEESTEEEEASKDPKPEAWRVPSIDLWIPARQNPSSIPGELASVTVLSKGLDVNRKRRLTRGNLLVAEKDQAPEGLEPGTSPSVNIQAEEELAVEDTRISRSKKDSWRVSLAYVKCVLRRNSYELQRRDREKSRKRRFASASRRRGLGRDLVPPAREPARGQRDGMWKMTVTRRLMMAVAPWTGSRVQAWARQVKSKASHKSKVEFIFKYLQTASLKSTPLFTLFIQLLHIDVDGCMKIIQKRKSRQLELLQAVAGNASGTSQASPSQDSTAQPSLPVGSSKKLIPLKAKEGPLPAHLRPAFPPPRPPSKPKTVSELLREKRLPGQSNLALLREPMGDMRSAQAEESPAGCGKEGGLQKGSMGPGTKKAPAACALGPAGSQQNSVKLVPPLAALPLGSPEAAKQIHPVTWLLTAQGLLPVTVVSPPCPGKPSALLLQCCLLPEGQPHSLGRGGGKAATKETHPLLQQQHLRMRKMIEKLAERLRAWRSQLQSGLAYLGFREAHAPEDGEGTCKRNRLP
ncbi:UNVERIFIED_CONTAM: hypothetical protein K2H54_048875 [Gekko kuhli]